MQIDLSDYSRGAGMATELVNSGPDVRRLLGESLPDPAALAGFLDRFGVGFAASADPGATQAETRLPTDRDLEQVYALRHRVGTALRAETAAEVVDRANALVSTAGVGPRLSRTVVGQDCAVGQGWHWHVATSPRASLADQLAVLIGVGLLGTLRALGHERFRGCTAPDCDGVFVDVSRAGRRRYCMPELCGNRTNVARHRARQRRADDHQRESDHLR